MADDTERLVLQMSADLRRFEREMARSRTVADRRLAEVEARARAADRNLSNIMDGAGRNMVAALQRNLSAIAPTLAAAFSAQQVIQYADSYTSLQNRLKAAGLEGQALKRVEDSLYETANRNGLQVQATAELYQRASLSRQRLGASEADLLKLVSGTAAALKVQGTSAEAASGPLLQLGQALSGNKVQAEEYNSLIDGLPVVLQAAAKGSARFGGDVAKLTEQVKDGKVTSQEFFQALLNGFPQIEQQAAGSATTVAGALQTLDNELGKFIGRADTGVSASQRMAAGIEGLANNLDLVTQVIGAVAAIMGVRFVLAMTAGTGAMIANGVAAVRLAGFQTAMTASMMGTTRAALVSTTAMRGFTAAIAANPIGAALLAVTALSGAIVLLGNKLQITGQATREVKQANDALAAATDAYAEAANAAAIATGEEAKVARSNAAAKREQAIATRQAAQAKLADAAATVAQIQAQAQRQLDLERRAPIRGDRPGSVQTIGREQRQRLADAQANEAASRSSIDAANKAIAAADAVLRRPAASVGGGAVSAPSGGGGGRAAGASGPSAEDISRQRELLALQAQVELLRAQGREEEAKAAQRQIDVLNLTKQFEDAKVPNAKKSAEDQVAALALAEDTSTEIDKLLAASEKRNERRAESLRLQREEQDRQNDALLEQVQFEAELARLSGDPTRIQQAERELYIEQRVNDLLRDRVGLITEADRANAERQASSEFNALERAGVSGDMREEFRRSFVDGMRAALDGDMGGMFESLADRFTDRMLDNLADDLFNLLSQAAGSMKGGAGGIGSVLGAIGGLFGKRATGGPVTAGQPYVVGERRPEVFVPNVNGTVIPSLNAAMARVQGGGQHTLNTTIKIDLTGANGDATIRRIAYQAAAEGSLLAQQRAMQDIPRQQGRIAAQQLGRPR